MLQSLGNYFYSSCYVHVHVSCTTGQWQYTVSSTVTLTSRDRRVHASLDMGVIVVTAAYLGALNVCIRSFNFSIDEATCPVEFPLRENRPSWQRALNFATNVAIHTFHLLVGTVFLLQRRSLLNVSRRENLRKRSLRRSLLDHSNVD